MLVREALHGSASKALALVDEGFRIPFIDPTGSVPRDPGGPRGGSAEGPFSLRSEDGREKAGQGEISVIAEGSESVGEAWVSPVTEGELWSARVLSQAGSEMLQPLRYGDHYYHLVQDKELIESIHDEELPPEEYYEELGKLMRKWFPEADPTLSTTLCPWWRPSTRGQPSP